MKFFQKRQSVGAYVVASFNVSTGVRDHGHPLTSRIVAERFAEQFNDEDGPVIYTVEECTPEMLVQIRRRTYQQRAEQVEFNLFDRKISNETLHIILSTQSIISLLCSIAQTDSSLGAVMYILRVYCQSLRLDMQVRWYAIRHWKQHRRDMEIADLMFEDVLHEVVSKSTKSQNGN